MSIVVKKEDLTKIVCDAIVNPANSFGVMGGGVARAIKKAGGSDIETEAMGKAPIPVGSAIYTTSGKLPCKFVIHAPTMKQPAMKIGVKNVMLATKAALDLGLELELKSIAIPGIGTGVGQVPINAAAREIVSIVKGYVDNFDTIYLIDRNEDMVEAFSKYI